MILSFAPAQVYFQGLPFQGLLPRPFPKVELIKPNVALMSSFLHLPVALKMIVSQTGEGPGC